MNSNEFASVQNAPASAPKKRKKEKLPRELQQERSSNIWVYLSAFMLPFLIMLGVYACLGKHPFGDGSVLTLDLQAQYVYYFEAIRDLILEGGSWLYSFQRTLGGEFMGIVAYYCASPFNLIFVLFPDDMMADAVMMMQLLKVGTMGLTFAVYLKHTRKTSDMLTVSFAMMYALSAYSVVNLVNPMWLDAMVFLPLLVLGIESMIRQRKFILYTVSLVTIMVTNYYIGYMCCIFTFFYFLYYYLLVRDEIPQNVNALNGNPVKRFFCSRGLETLMRFGVFSILAAVISAFMLLTAIYSLQFGKTGFSNPDFAVKLRFDFLDIFVKLLPGSYDTVRPNGLPMIYCGMLALISLPLFFMSKTISGKKKLLTAALCLIFVVSFSVNTIDLVWHGFSAPNWLNYRYSFMFSFVLVVMACDAIRGLKKIPFVWIGSVGAVIGVLILVVQKLNYTVEQAEGKQVPLDDAKCIVVSLVLLAIYLFILHYMKQDKMERAGVFALAVIVCVEMFATSLISVGGLQMDVGTVRYDNYLSDNGKTEYYSGYQGAIRRIEDVVDAVLANDKSLYRMESTVYRREGGVNEPMAFGYNGISHSTSTLNREVIDFMETIGYASQSHWTKYIGATPVADALLGIKYVVTKNDKLDPEIYTVAAEGPEDYKFIPSDNIIYAMQNTKALPFAYGVSPAVAEYLDDFIQPPFRSALDAQNELVNTMLNGVIDAPDVLKGIYSTFTLKHCKSHTFNQPTPYTDEFGEEQSTYTEYYAFTPNEGATTATIRYVLDIEHDGPVYFHVAGVLFSGMTTDVEIKVNGSKVCNYFTNETWVAQKLGDFEKGDRVEVDIVFNNGLLYYSAESEYVFYSLDYEAMNEAFYYLENAGMYVEEHGNDYLKGSITLPKGQELIFTTISYDEGWKVKVDGVEVETEKVAGALMAIPSTEGYHEIEMVYRPDCAVYGGMASLAGILIFAALILWSMFRTRGKRLSVCGGHIHFFYHKGDETFGWMLEEAEAEAANKEDPTVLNALAMQELVTADASVTSETALPHEERLAKESASSETAASSEAASEAAENAPAAEEPSKKTSTPEQETQELTEPEPIEPITPDFLYEPVKTDSADVKKTPSEETN